MTPHPFKSRPAVFSAFLLVTLVAPALADLPTPTGAVILTIEGAISETNTPTGAAFDLTMLQALPTAGFETSTIWTVGKSRFDGVPLKTLLDAVGAAGGTVTATALNNYTVQFPMDAIEDDFPIVAYHIDGKPFSRRDKGPLWIVFPYDSGSNYQTELVYGRSIWHLAGLKVAD